MRVFSCICAYLCAFCVLLFVCVYVCVVDTCGYVCLCLSVCRCVHVYVDMLIFL